MSKGNVVGDTTEYTLSVKELLQDFNFWILLIPEII